MAWLSSNWTYRKSITLSRASGAVTFYQMKLLVGESAGAVGEDVDCGGNVQSTFDDLRFTASDGTTLLDYWIESITGTTPNQLATVWIEFDSIGTDNTTFYMYYGNADATVYSNGSNTFILFDDFDDASVNAALWDSTIAGTGVITESGTTIKCDPAGTGVNAGAKVLSDILFSNNNRIKIKVRFEGTLVNYNYPACGLLDGSTEDGTGFTDAFFLRWNGAEHPCTTRKDGGTILATIVGSYIVADGSTWNLIDLKYLNQNCIMNIGGTDRATHTTANQVPTTDPMHITIGSVNNNSVSPSAEKWIEVDWVFLAQYLATEPSWGSWGSEETEPSPSVSPSISPSASISPSISPSASPSLSPSASISPSESPSLSPSASVSPSISASVSPSISPSASPSVSPSESPSISPSVSPSVSPSESPSLSPSASVSPSVSPSISPSESPSLSPSASISPSISPSASPSLSPSASPSESPSESPSPSPSFALEDYFYDRLRMEKPSIGPEGSFYYEKI